MIKTQSMSIIIGWSDLLCDGGHTIRSFTIRNRMQTYFSYFHYIRNIDPTLRNYTITGLEPNSLYSIQVQTVNTGSIGSSFSSPRFVSTLPPGKRRNYIIVFIPLILAHRASIFFSFLQPPHHLVMLLQS